MLQAVAPMSAEASMGSLINIESLFSLIISLIFRLDFSLMIDLELWTKGLPDPDKLDSGRELRYQAML